MPAVLDVGDTVVNRTEPLPFPNIHPSARDEQKQGTDT